MTAVHPPKVHLPDEDSATSKTTIHASKTGNRGNAKILRLGQGLSGERVMPVFKKLPPRGSVRVRIPPSWVGVSAVRVSASFNFRNYRLVGWLMVRVRTQLRGSDRFVGQEYGLVNLGGVQINESSDYRLYKSVTKTRHNYDD